MNFKRLLLFLAAPLALVMSSCEPDGPVYTTPSITITDAEGAEVTAINFAAVNAEDATKPQEFTLTITATRGWSISKQETWLSVAPSTYTNDTMEEKSVEVKVSVGPNDGDPRSETLKVVMDKIEKSVVVSQAGEGQTALGDVLYYDNFDKGTAVDNSGWPALDGFVNPVGAGADGATYSVANVQARSNSPSNNNYSGYKDTASGGNNAFFRTNGILTINNINLAGQESKDYTLTFGCYRSVYGEADNSFKASEFHVYISGDGEKWTELEYTRPADEVSSYGTWNLATATFTLKEKPATLSVCFKSDLTSSHRLDDVKLTAGGGGAEIDLAQGTTLEGAGSSSGSGDSGNNEPLVKDPNAETITVAQFLENKDANTTYQLTGVISGSVNTQYGSFDLVDETGTIYVYGLYEEDGSRVDWTAKGLNAGDTITVQGKYYYYEAGNKDEIQKALYISHVDGEEPEVPEVELPEGTIVWEFGKDKQTWADDTHATYSTGTAATVDNVKFGFYKNTNTNDWGTTLQNDHIRVFKGAALSISTLDGTKIKSVVFECAYADKCYNLSVSDGTTAVADTNALTISWTSEEGVSTFDAVASAGQVRLKKMYLVLEGEGSGDQGGEEPEDPEDPETPVEPTVATIASIVALGQNAVVAEGTFVEGVVISNSELNNLTSKKGLYIQDETAGLQFYCAANHSFAFGDKVKVDLSGVTVGAYGGAVQISSIALDKFEVLSSGNTVEAKTVSMADFLANKYEGQYIALEGVQVVAADLAKTWGDASSHISINMEDAEGNNFVVFSSKYATYATETVAQGSGTIKGISSINVKDGVTTMQIIFAQATDYAGLTGERFGDDNAGEEPETPVEPETLATLDANAYYVFKQATEFVPGKWYAIVAENNAATALTSNYGYLKVVTPIALTDGISLPASCAWGVVSTEGGYTIQQYDGKYVYQTGSYDSFNVDATAPTSGHVWTIENGVITNATTAKTVQFDTQYNSYGCYASVKGVYPMFYELVEVDTNAHLLGTSVSSLSFTAEAGEKTFTVNTLGEAALDATTAAEWLTVSVADGVVTVVAEANEGDAREATITVTYGEDSATVTVAQAAKPAAGVVEGGNDDFNTVSANNNYGTYTSTNGWVGVNCCVISGGESDNNPVLKSLLGDDTNTRAFVINGKTTAVGKITSPSLVTGCGTLSLNYGIAYSESNAPKFKVEIMQKGAAVQTYTVVGSTKTKYASETWSQVVNVAGEFQIVITNLSPTNSTSNKDRTAIWNVEWTGYAE